MKLFQKLKINRLQKRGLRLGNNVKIEKGVMLDASFPYLINIGSNVTIAPHVQILSHDASTKPFINYTKIGQVRIGNNVFIGAKSIILPNTTIGDNVIIGAGSIVTKDIPSNTVVAGTPAKKISDLGTYLKKNNITQENQFDENYKTKKITKQKKQKVIEKTEKHGICYID